MSLLFETPLIAGLAYAENVISEAEEQELLERLSSLELAPFRFHGWLGNRKTQSFGWRYDFDDARFTPAEPMPEWLQTVRQRAACFAEVKPEDFVHVLLARYDPGAGIGWHRDRDVFEKVVGISHATPATLRFRRRIEAGFTRAKLEVMPRSAYLLSGESRWLGSTALRRASFCGFPSRFGRCQTRASASPHGSTDRTGAEVTRLLSFLTESWVYG